MNKAFWRKNKTLSWNEQVLLDKCLEAHKQATFRENVSSQIIKASYQCNGEDFLKAVSAGLGSVGGLHAPIAETYEFLSDPSHVIHTMSLGHLYGKVYGWGSSFVKGKPDPVVETAMLYIDTGWPEMGKTIEAITDLLHILGKKIYPNMAALTASTAIILGLPKPLASMLFLQGRALAWAEICHDIKGPASKE